MSSKANAEGDVERTKQLAQEEIARIKGEQKLPTDERNEFQKAIDDRNEAIAKLNQQISSRAGRALYNKDLQRRKKKK